MKLPVLLLVLVGSSLIFIGGCSTLSAAPVTARVVDADTGKPLVGVAIEAYWELHEGSLFGHSSGCGAIYVEGAVTDSNGEFHIPGWGPITVYGSCDMRGDNPSLILFKPGYDYQGLNNAALYNLNTVVVSSSIYDGEIIKLHKAADLDLRRPSVDPRSYAEQFSSLNDVIGRYALAGCNWKKIPDMLRAIYLQEQGFRAAGQVFDTVTSSLIRNDAEIQKATPECGSPKAFIEGLVK